LNSDSNDLAESRKILERIHKRQLYKYLGSFVLPQENDKIVDIHSIENDVKIYFIKSKKYLILNELNYLFQVD
jgi:hypothetical protein